MNLLPELYRVGIKSFPGYKHLLQENYVEYKHIFFLCFLLGDSLASEFYKPTFRNTICSIFIDKKVNND
jgi:hypothetical protein